MNALRILLTNASIGLCIGLPVTLLLAGWTWFEITPALAFDTGLLMIGGAVAGLVWGIFAAVFDETPARWLAVVPVLAALAAFALLGRQWQASLTVPGLLLGEAAGLHALNACWSTALLGVCMLPALVLPLLPRA